MNNDRKHLAGALTAGFWAGVLAARAGRRPSSPASSSPAPKTSEKDKWSAHLEFCKLIITLATALLTATAVIYADSSKVPRGTSRYILLFCDVSLIATLGCSIMASIYLSNLLLYSDDPDVQALARRGAKVTKWAGSAFGFLMLSGLFLVVFFFCKVYWPKVH